jgi:hypothetical protein
MAYLLSPIPVPKFLNATRNTCTSRSEALAAREGLLLSQYTSLDMQLATQNAATQEVLRNAYAAGFPSNVSSHVIN